MIGKCSEFIFLCAITHVTVQSPTCGQNFTSSEGSFAHPISGRHYSDGQDCTWTISSRPGNRILIHFRTFVVEYSINCIKDYVQIYDGGDPKTLPARRYCGYYIPSPYLSSGPVVRVTFHSDSIYGYVGFTLSWTVADTFTYVNKSLDWSGARRWCSNSGCFLAKYKPETAPSILEVVPEEVGGAVWTAKYYTPWSWLKGCFMLPQHVTEDTFRLSTSVKWNQQKICVTHCRKFNYYALQDETCSCLDDLHEGFRFVPTATGCRTQCPGDGDQRCGGKDSVTVYMNNLCWTNSTEWTGTVTRTISGRSCQKWNENTTHSHVYHSNSAFPDVTTDAASNYCRDPSGSGKPWCYTTDPYTRNETCDVPKCFSFLNAQKQGCAVVNTYTASHEIGVFQRPCGDKCGHFCQYSDSIKYPAVGSSMLTWTESRGLCRDNNYGSFTFGNVWVMFVYWWDDIYRWIGYSRNTTDETESVLNLTPTDCFSISKTDTGFVENVVSCQDEMPFVCQYPAVVCGGRITMEYSGNITSPDYPRGYSPNMHCEWTIHVEDGSYITIDFTYICMEESLNCHWDYIQVYDGSRLDVNGSLGRFCGHVNDTVRMTSTGNVMTVVFHSDGSRSDSGFSARWTSVAVTTTTTTTVTALTVVETGIDKPDKSDKSGGANGGLYAWVGGTVLAIVALVIALVVVLKRRRRRMTSNPPENLVVFDENANPDAESGTDIPIYDTLNDGPNNTRGESDKCVINTRSLGEYALCHDNLENSNIGTDGLNEDIYDTAEAEVYHSATSTYNVDTAALSASEEMSVCSPSQDNVCMEEYRKEDQNTKDDNDSTSSLHQRSNIQKGVTTRGTLENADSIYSHCSHSTPGAGNDYDYTCPSLPLDEIRHAFPSAKTCTPISTGENNECMHRSRDLTLTRNLDAPSNVYSHAVLETDGEYDHTPTYKPTDGTKIIGHANPLDSLYSHMATGTENEYDHTLTYKPTDGTKEIGHTSALDSVYSNMATDTENEYAHTPYYKPSDRQKTTGHTDSSDSVYSHTAKNVENDYDHTLTYNPLDGMKITGHTDSLASEYNHITKCTEGEYDHTSSYQSQGVTVAGQPGVDENNYNHTSMYMQRSNTGDVSATGDRDVVDDTDDTYDTCSNIEAEDEATYYNSGDVYRTPE